uniref:uncharacterized protein LOC108950247 n=1 Tax=Ciona intestinalis TaxID=7719 RepID=UPI00089DCE8A|nr:uncharacterized protein LOC108950247 [Ciona intestinalis]|eukprot:XP_018671001.1 uncharacterized protein LOC108950247 [Ciona intestinalis]
MHLSFFLLLFCPALTFSTDYSCYQNISARSLIWDRNFYGDKACPYNGVPQACVSIEAKVRTLLGNGNLLIGECVNATSCENITCQDYETKTLRINPFFRLDSCTVTCCYSNGCNNVTIKEISNPFSGFGGLPLLPGPVILPVVNTTMAVPPHDNSTTPEVPPPIIVTTPEMPPPIIVTTPEMPPPIIVTTAEMPPIPTTNSVSEHEHHWHATEPQEQPEMEINMPTVQSMLFDAEVTTSSGNSLKVATVRIVIFSSVCLAIFQMVLFG